MPSPYQSSLFRDAIADDWRDAIGSLNLRIACAQLLRDRGEISAAECSDRIKCLVGYREIFERARRG